MQPVVTRILCHWWMWVVLASGLFLALFMPSKGPLWQVGQRALASMAAGNTSATQFPPGTFSVSYVTAPNEEVAKRLAEGLVQKKLAACVNMVPNILSVYEWKNEIQRDKEVLMVIKSRTARLEELTTYVRENHPYEVCEVISTPIQHGNPPYLQWLADVVPPGGHTASG